MKPRLTRHESATDFAHVRHAAWEVERANRKKPKPVTLDPREAKARLLDRLFKDGKLRLE